ncbi:MAG: hypothetical protein M1831_000617 [Alyxoria varia]|nr:MAG: hypothetical protein M1831_000617 [Alyxoria varia]
MSSPTHVTSLAHFNSILSSSVYVIVDFYADWCGPCKAIAPTFDQLASSESKRGKMAFVKVDVDSRQDVAGQYDVSAMPTFLIIKNSKVVDTIRGADTSSLRSAISKASADAVKATARTSAAFTSKGHVLGSNSTTSRTTTSFQVPGLSGGGANTITRFFGLYFTTLLSFDTTAAAENSPFAVNGGNKTR